MAEQRAYTLVIMNLKRLPVMSQWQSASHRPVRTAVLWPQHAPVLSLSPTPSPACWPHRLSTPQVLHLAFHLQQSQCYSIRTPFNELAWNCPAVYFFSITPGSLTSFCDRDCALVSILPPIAILLTEAYSFWMFSQRLLSKQPESQNGGYFFLEHTKSEMFFRTSMGSVGSRPAQGFGHPQCCVDTGAIDSVTSMLWNIFWEKIIWFSIRWFLTLKSLIISFNQTKHTLFQLKGNLQMISLPRKEETLRRTWLGSRGGTRGQVWGEISMGWVSGWPGVFN